jgi:hypothetical protein
MKTIVGLFRERERLRRALDDLDAAGLSSADWRVLASPTSAGEAARRAAHELGAPGPEVIDVGAFWGGQAAPEFPAEERRLTEERVAQGDALLQVRVPDETADRVEAILRAAGAERVLPGTVRD